MNMVVWFSRIVEIAADRKKFTPKDNEMSNVILGILEAAGKVDKVKALDGMETLRAMMSRELLMNTGPTFQLVHALLESLPEKEQK